MTQQDTEAFVARLTRIWGTPVKISISVWEPEDGYLGDISVGFVAYVEENVVLNYQLSDGEVVIFLEDELESLALWCQDEQIKPTHTRCEDEMKYASNELLDQFASDRLSYFRRRCWLSGANIEASAHEKAEWILSFTREELESWNLMM